MFASPVFYPAQLLSGDYGFFLWLNPMTPLIEAFRAFCFGKEAGHAVHFWAAGAAVLVVLALGIAIFKRHEVSINDIV
jgi:lipopolysaccharide transport system permease protein